MKNIGYKFFRFVLKPVYKFYYNPKIYNKEVLKGLESPLIFAGNHIHIMDQNNVIISTNKVITYMAKKEYFDSAKTRWFFKIVGCIPVDREGDATPATNKALEVLKGNGNIGIFPEGTRNKTKEKLLPFKFGTVSMANKTNATIVPYAIVGEYKFRSKTLKVKFGTPFKVENGDLEKANTYLRNTISDMIDELNEMNKTEK